MDLVYPSVCGNANTYIIIYFFNITLQLAEALLEKETLNYDEVVNLIGPPAFDASKRTVEPVEFEQSLKNLSEDPK